ncbi:2-dehydropantoate 2-reductase [Bacillus mangrovi]|uniref:2-dehydropantoate 2-reductase n=1 Tax=Metabacillus mangrovi TaxID=1491830 RepID=A0A7X2S184_9BACI|nr:ketopantoate reductase family protein [Metabacillus mangrovi]MTH51962.1 2-dehydropantoate 2-reductase [Metabacillus mangrovi]
MKFLVAGAGGVGGYFGSRLDENGEDVTFLVRESRQNQLAQSGMNVHSIHGNYSFTPKTVTKTEGSIFDVVLLCTKSYQLEQMLQDLQPFIDKETVIIPLLNGMAHLEKITNHFSREQVMGGLVFIEAYLSQDGTVHQTSSTHRMVFGEWDGTSSRRAEAVRKAFEGSRCEVKVSTEIEKDMWEKYLFIAAMSGVTSLFSQPVGPIRELAWTRGYLIQLIKEMESIMRKSGAHLSSDIAEKHMKTMDAMKYEMKSSMLRDLELGKKTEASHLQGILAELAHAQGVSAPCLQTVFSNLQLHEQGF